MLNPWLGICLAWTETVAAGGRQNIQDRLASWRRVCITLAGLLRWRSTSERECPEFMIPTLRTCFQEEFTEMDQGKSVDYQASLRDPRKLASVVSPTVTQKME